jgi:hypothetical protein
MSKHTKEKPYKCQYCLQSFQEEGSVKRHRDGKVCKRKLKYPLPLLSPCYFCDKMFSTHQNLKVHMKMIHLKEDLRRCNRCYKYFSTTAINHHILERNYKCQLCSKRFGYKSDLNQHIQSAHTKEKPFKCYFCSKSFINFRVLKFHTWIHTREKSLTCYFCRKDFSFVRDLSIHIGRFHTKERPFKCIQCQLRCYSSKSNLNAHVRKKHGVGLHQ